MIKYFELLLELLEINNKENYIKLANQIETNPNRKLLCYHKHSFVFEGYQKLLTGEITQEEFTQIGDIRSKIFFDTKKQDSISYLKSKPVLDNNILFIFDKVSEDIIEEKENIIYC